MNRSHQKEAKKNNLLKPLVYLERFQGRHELLIEVNDVEWMMI